MIARLRLYMLLVLIACLLLTIIGLTFRARRAERQLGEAAAQVAALTGKVAEARRVSSISPNGESGERSESAKRMVAAGARVVAQAAATFKTQSSSEGNKAAGPTGQSNAAESFGVGAAAGSEAGDCGPSALLVTDNHHRIRLELERGEPDWRIADWTVTQRFVVTNLWFDAGTRRFTGATLTELDPETGEALGVYEAEADDIAATYTLPPAEAGLRRFGWSVGFYAGMSAVSGKPDAGAAVMWGVRF